MNESVYTVGISCVGSGVGQSVINSCRLASIPVRTVGLGTNPMAYGLYECDDYAYTASYYDDDYVGRMILTCKEHQIDLLIPGHDDEAHTLSKNVEAFEREGIRVLVSGANLLSLCREKDVMSRELNPIANIFVRSFSRETFLDAWEAKDIELPVIAKPRDGFASRGIEIVQSKEDFDRITDGHIVQELALPHDGDSNREHCLKMIAKGINPQVAEISIQYVLDQSGSLLGKMASYNKLNNGVPIEILPYEDESMWADVDALLPTLVELGARGPVNLQGRMTNKGIKLFEINARFTGITGLRAALGFNEVEACIRNWLSLETVALSINQNRVGIRQTADKAVDMSRNPEVRDSVRRLNNSVLKNTKTILVTGASGAIGGRLVRELSSSSNFEIWTLDRNKQALAENSASAHQIYDYTDLAEGRFSLGNVDCLIHLASARPHSGEAELAESLSTTFALFTRAASQGVSEIVNLSSQSVYGTKDTPPWTEKSVVQPAGAYACYKYSIETHLNSLKALYPMLNATSIRLAAVAAPDVKSLQVEALGHMVAQAIAGGDLKVYGGEQRLERIDVRDAVAGVVAVLEASSAKWKPIYNLGPGEQYPLSEIAQIIVDEVNSAKIGSAVGIEIVESQKAFPSFGMDVSAFQEDFSWSSQYTIRDSIRCIIELLSPVDGQYDAPHTI